MKILDGSFPIFLVVIKADCLIFMSLVFGWEQRSSIHGLELQPMHLIPLPISVSLNIPS